jgi:hypothetical protein
MNVTGYVDIAIAFIFIILLLCIVTSGINELIMYALKRRGKFLKSALTEVFNDSRYNRNYTEMLYDHPLVDMLKRDDKSLPAYISSSIFASGMIDIIGNEYEKEFVRFVQDEHTLEEKFIDEREEPDPYERFKKGVEAMKYSDLKILLRTIAENSANLIELRANLAKWYDDYMDRVSGWYKSKSQLWLFLIGLCVAITLNVDCFRLVSELNTNTALRGQVALAAENYLETHPVNVSSPDSLKLIFNSIDSAYQELNAFDLPIGWQETKPSDNFVASFFTENRMYFEKGEWVQTIVGWIITAALLSFGSPFWFQLLNKLVDLRKAGRKPEPTNTEKTVN